MLGCGWVARLHCQLGAKRGQVIEFPTFHLITIRALGMTFPKKECLFLGIAQIRSLPHPHPPTPPIQASWSSFFGRKKQPFCAWVWRNKVPMMTTMQCNGWNDNHYGDNGNDENITKKHTNIMTFEQESIYIRDYYSVKKGQQIGQGPPSPSWFGQCPKVNILFWGGGHP